MPTVIDDDDDESLVGDSRVVRTAEKEASVEIDTSQDSKGIMVSSTFFLVSRETPTKFSLPTERYKRAQVLSSRLPHSPLSLPAASNSSHLIAP